MIVKVKEAQQQRLDALIAIHYEKVGGNMCLFLLLVRVWCVDDVHTYINRVCRE